MQRRLADPDAREMKESNLAFLFISPTLLIVGLVFIWPVLYSLWLSFNRYNLTSSPNPTFAWLHNYSLIFTDPFYRSDVLATTARTTLFSVISVPVELILGLSFALLLNEEFPGRTFFRSVMIVPYAMLTISNGLVWDYILDPTYGTLNVILQRWGLISNYQNWLGTPNGAMGWVIAADVWKTTPFMTIILLAALQTFPSNVFKAAEVDGAGAIKRFWHITLPMLRSAILVALVLRTLGAFRVYDIIYVLTGGGPADATNVLSYYVYQQAFINFHIGYASAVAYLTTIAMVLIILIYLWVLRSDTAQ
ncbi:MAG: sugar transporter permease [Chloroflexi bacterium]|nr:sugar transporter permease [Chloroflexota bacterium]